MATESIPPSPSSADPQGSPGGLSGTVADISDAELLERAVRNCRDRHSPKRVDHPRWVAVMDAFALGSTYAQQLCRRFGMDPDEMVRR